MGIDYQKDTDKLRYCNNFVDFLLKGDVKKKFTNFCMICFKDKNEELFTSYTKKSKIQNLTADPDCEKDCDEYKNDFITKINNQEIDIFETFFKNSSKMKCYHFFHKKCKQGKKGCELCKNGFTVQNINLFGQIESELDYILYYYRFGSYFGNPFSFPKNDFDKTAHKFIQDSNEISEEAKKIYSTKNKLELKYRRNVLGYKCEELSLNDIKKYGDEFETKLKEERKERIEAKKAQKKEKKSNNNYSESSSSSSSKKESEVFVSFCTSCGSNCVFCGHEKAGTSQNWVKAHKSCSGSNNKCNSCGKSVIGLMKPYGFFCSKCDSQRKLKFNLCYFCKEKL